MNRVILVDAARGNPASINALDGVNMIPYLQGLDTKRPHPTLYWKMETRGAIRDGDWKLLRFPDRPTELYNIVEDASEQNNLAAEHPEIVKTLYGKLFTWELELERPLFMLRRAEEGWSARRTDQFRKPTSESY
jgi:arylsulfatase A-like enzyme